MSRLLNQISYVLTVSLVSAGIMLVPLTLLAHFFLSIKLLLAFQYTLSANFVVRAVTTYKNAGFLWWVPGAIFALLVAVAEPSVAPYIFLVDFVWVVQMNHSVIFTAGITSIRAATTTA
jgi:hypothetical protein